MAGKLTEYQMALLEAMIGCGPKRFLLLYSITRDGCNAAEFHRKCDNQGPTVTVLFNPQGSVYGGYAGVSWQSSGNNTKDDTAFIFQLVYSGKRVMNVFRPKKHEEALYFHNNRAADFNDFESFSDSVCISEDGTFTLDGKVKLGNCYHSNNVSNDDINNGNMVVKEMEVYSVSDVEIRCRPWQKFTDFNDQYIESLTKEIALMEPPRGSDVTNFRLLLIGPTSGGKSSFINTALSAFAGKMIQKVVVGESKQGVTNRYMLYPVRQTDGTNLHVSLCDTPGIGECSGMDAINLHFLLDGHLPPSFEFSSSRHVGAKSIGYIAKPTLAQEIHSVALVLDASTVSDLSPTIKFMVNDCRRLILEKGIHVVVILTKIDKLHEEIAVDLADVFNHPEVKAAADKVSETFGIPPNHVFPMKNYHSEAETNMAVHALALTALRGLVFTAFDVLDERNFGGEKGQAVSTEVTESDTA